MDPVLRGWPRIEFGVGEGIHLTRTDNELEEAFAVVGNNWADCRTRDLVISNGCSGLALFGGRTGACKQERGVFEALLETVRGTPGSIPNQQTHT
jgi:hypothetical protein